MPCRPSSPTKLVNPERLLASPCPAAVLRLHFRARLHRHRGREHGYRRAERARQGRREPCGHLLARGRRAVRLVHPRRGHQRHEAQRDALHRGQPHAHLPARGQPHRDRVPYSERRGHADNRAGHHRALRHRHDRAAVPSAQGQPVVLCILRRLHRQHQRPRRAQPALSAP